MLIHLGIATIISIAVVLLGGFASGTFSAGRLNNLANSENYKIIVAVATAGAYLLANLTVFGVGCKITKIKPKSLFKFNGFLGEAHFRFHCDRIVCSNDGSDPVHAGNLCNTGHDRI